MSEIMKFNSIHVRNYETNSIHVRKFDFDPHFHGKINYDNNTKALNIANRLERNLFISECFFSQKFLLCVRITYQQLEFAVLFNLPIFPAICL